MKYIKRGYMHPIKKEFCSKCGQPVTNLNEHMEKHREAQRIPAEAKAEDLTPRQIANKINHKRIREGRNIAATEVLKELGAKNE
jgi:protein-disulfide isomerase-like protein with CxxC motif